MRMTKVISQVVDPSGQSVGTYDDNPLLNSIVYDVQYPDGEVKEYAVNVGSCWYCGKMEVIPLKDMNESHLTQTAEFVVA
eukprot:11385548-Ditylum_brightwellii.AAC.2